MIENENNQNNLMNEVNRNKANLIKASKLSQCPVGENIGCGIGFMTRNNISSGLGIHTISMMLVISELHRQIFKFNPDSRIQILLADSHSIDQLSSPKDINKIISLTEKAAVIIPRLLQIFKVPVDSIDIILASKAPWQSQGDYLQRETSDILAFHKMLKWFVKVGWKSSVKAFDEVLFDNLALNTHGFDLRGMSFIYTTDAPSLVAENTHFPPYFAETIPGANNQPFLGNQFDLISLKKTRESERALSSLGSEINRHLNIRYTNSLSTLQNVINECIL
jgi:hypothetical protein